MSQTLCSDQSCQQALALINAERVSSGLPLASADTGAYCKARERLPESLLYKLVKRSGECLQRNAQSKWLWKGRAVKLIDGSTISMPDTQYNQLEYPQQKMQKKGLGFPIARIVGILSLATGGVVDLAIGPYHGKKSGEHALLRQLLENFKAGEVVLADAYYCSYFLIATLQTLGVEVVCKLHGARSGQVKTLKKVGKNDVITRYMKPNRPEWMEKRLYDQMPESVEVRHVGVKLNRAGFRTSHFTIVTTLKDEQMVTSEDLLALYRQRWNVELDLRNIKVTMQMGVLRCKTPSMVRKELWAHLLSYNLIRTMMAESAMRSEISPREISFKNALQTYNTYRLLWMFGTKIKLESVYQAMLQSISEVRVAQRPNRIEPRANKRRFKHLGLLTQPRCKYKQKSLTP
jgi:hypothetical protein